MGLCERKTPDGATGPCAEHDQREDQEGNGRSIRSGVVIEFAVFHGPEFTGKALGRADDLKRCVTPSHHPGPPRCGVAEPSSRGRIY